MRVWIRIGLAAALTLTAVGARAEGTPAPAAASGALSAEGPMRREGTLKVGEAAPDFTLQDVEGRRTVRLSDLKGKPVVLIFGSCT